MEVAAPPVQLRLESVALEGGALPGGEVGVLKGQGRKGGGLAVALGLVEGRQLADEDAHGPAIGDDVVHGEEEDEEVLVQAKQGGAKQGAVGEGEGAKGVLGGEAAQVGVALGGVERAQVDLEEQEGAGGGDELGGPMRARAEGGAQGFMARHEELEAALQCGDVQGTLDANGGREVVAGAVGLQLVQDPQALLGEGQGQRAGARQRR